MQIPYIVFLIQRPECRNVTPVSVSHPRFHTEWDTRKWRRMSINRVKYSFPQKKHNSCKRGSICTSLSGPSDTGKEFSWLLSDATTAGGIMSSRGSRIWFLSSSLTVFTTWSFFCCVGLTTYDYYPFFVGLNGDRIIIPVLCHSSQFCHQGIRFWRLGSTQNLSYIAL